MDTLKCNFCNQVFYCEKYLNEHKGKKQCYKFPQEEESKKFPKHAQGFQCTWCPTKYFNTEIDRDNHAKFCQGNTTITQYTQISGEKHRESSGGNFYWEGTADVKKPLPKKLPFQRSILQREFGVANKNGQLNCFLNVCLQSLWQFPSVREKLKIIFDLPAVQNGCCKIFQEFLMSLQDFYKQAQNPDLTTVPKLECLKIRAELFKLHYQQEEFILNSKADAFEALDKILSIIHGWLVCETNHLENFDFNSTLELPCDQQPCAIHQLFFVEHMSQKVCECGAKGQIEKPHPNQFAVTVSIHEILQLFKSSQSQTFFQGQMIDAMGYLSNQQQNGCPRNKDSHHSHRKINNLYHAPEVLILNLSWVDPTPSEISQILISVPDIFGVKQLYSDPNQQEAKYVFKGMICFQAAHYLSFFRRVITKLEKLGVDPLDFFNQMAQLKKEQSQGWTLFDDDYVVSIGQWQDVIKYCVKNRCYPTVLLFEKLSPSEQVTEQLQISTSDLYDLQALSKQSDLDHNSDFDSGFSQEAILEQIKIEQQFKKNVSSQSNASEPEQKISSANLKSIKKKYQQDKIYLFPCNKCDGGIQALHLGACINKKCGAENHFKQALDVNPKKWIECIQEIISLTAKKPVPVQIVSDTKMVNSQEKENNFSQVDFGKKVKQDEEMKKDTYLAVQSMPTSWKWPKINLELLLPQSCLACEKHIQWYDVYQNYKLEDLYVKEKVPQKIQDDLHWECNQCDHPNSISNIDSCLQRKKSSGVPQPNKEIKKEIQSDWWQCYLCNEIQCLHRFEKCRKCGNPSFEISTKIVKVLPEAVQIQPDTVKNKCVCNCCTMSNKIDLNNLNSAICEACETKDENIQIVSALRSKPAQEDKWKCVYCRTINVVEWNRVGSSVCKLCNEQDLSVKNKIEVKFKCSSKKSCTKCNVHCKTPKPHNEIVTIRKVESKLEHQVQNFEPTEVVVWLIANTNYDKCRPVEDLPEVQKSYYTILNHFISLGIQEVIIKAYNSKKDFLKQKKMLYDKLILLDTQNRKKLLLFVYFAGHGAIIKSQTNIMFNEERDEDRFVNLEGLLRGWTESKKNNYIIALFDCCRHYIWQPEPKTIKVTKKVEPKKVLQPRSLSVKIAEQQNLHIIFASYPGREVRADSQLTAVFSLVVEAQLEAGKGVLGKIDTQLLKVNCNEELDIVDDTTSQLLWRNLAWIGISNSQRRQRANSAQIRKFQDVNFEQNGKFEHFQDLNVVANPANLDEKAKRLRDEPLIATPQHMIKVSKISLSDITEEQTSKFSETNTNNFNATHAIGFAVTNGQFNIIGQDNLESVIKDRENCYEHFKNLGIQNVIKAEDSYEEYKQGCYLLLQEVLKAHDPAHKRKLFIYAYFSSHGVVIYDGSSSAQIVFNTEEEEKRYQNAEKYLTKLAAWYNNIFIIAVFDICRTRQKKISVPNLPFEETNKKSSRFFIFRVEGDVFAPKTSALSAYLLKDGKMQAQTGFFTTLNDIELRRNISNAQCKLKKTQDLVWEIPNQNTTNFIAQLQQNQYWQMYEDLNPNERQKTKSIVQPKGLAKNQVLEELCEMFRHVDGKDINDVLLQLRDNKQKTDEEIKSLAIKALTNIYGPPAINQNCEFEKQPLVKVKNSEQEDFEFYEELKQALEISKQDAVVYGQAKILVVHGQAKFPVVHGQAKQDSKAVDNVQIREFECRLKLGRTTKMVGMTRNGSQDFIFPNKVTLDWSATIGDYIMGIQTDSKGCFGFMLSNRQTSHVSNNTSYSSIQMDTRKVEIFYNKDFICGFAVYNKDNKVWKIGDLGKLKEIVVLADNEVIVGVLAQTSVPKFGMLPQYYTIQFQIGTIYSKHGFRYYEQLN